MKYIKLYEAFGDVFPDELKYLFNRFEDGEYYLRFIRFDEEEEEDRDDVWLQVHISATELDPTFHNLLMELFTRLYNIGDFEFRINNVLCSTVEVDYLKIGSNHSDNFYNKSNVGLESVSGLLTKEFKGCDNINTIEYDYNTGLLFFFNEEFVDSI